MRSEGVLAWSAGVATVIGTIVAVLTYCSPQNGNAAAPTAPTVIKQTPKPTLRPLRLPLEHAWINASGPQTFSAKSSAGVIEGGRFGTALHVRFAVRNNSRVPAAVWIRSASQSRERSIEGWTVDAGTTLCSPRPDQFTVLPVGDPKEQLVRYNDTGSVVERAPIVASGGEIQFTARFECEQQIEQDAVLFATIRLTFAHQSGRRTIYFQNSALPIFLGKGVAPAP